MLENISDKFARVLKYLKGEAKITEDNIKQALREIKLSLLEADVNYRVVKEFVESVREQALGDAVQQSLTPYQHIVKIVQSQLESMLGEAHVSLVESAKKPTVIMLIGLQGTGKTTTAGKLAYFLKDRKKSSLLCSLDLKRPAAEEQLAVIADEIGVAGYQRKGRDNLRDIVKDVRKTSREYGYDYVIADTAGRLHVDESLMEELGRVKDELDPDETLYVADALTGQDAVTSAQRFSDQVDLDAFILTKLDADARGGAALSIVGVTDKPIKFIGVGERHGDLLEFHPDRLASKILGMGDVLTLIEKAEKDFDEKQARKTAQKILENEFTLEDLVTQLRQVRKLGSLGDIMGMLPGLAGQAGLPGGAGAAAMDEKTFDHMIAIVNSMTPEERRNPRILNGRRRLRISRGCGRPVQEINQLIKQFNEMKSIMKKPFFRRMLKRFDFSSKMM